YRQIDPVDARPLGAIGAPAAVAVDQALARQWLTGKRRDVEPRAEARAFAMEDHGAHPWCLGHLLRGRDDALEHRAVEGVVLVATRQGDRGNVVRDFDPDPFFAHGPDFTGAPRLGHPREGPV